jgi:hypothetical protein
MAGRRQGSDDGKKTSEPKRSRLERRPLPKMVRVEIMRLARRHRKLFAELFAVYPELRHRAGRLYGSLVCTPRKPGRRRSERITKALEFLRQFEGCTLTASDRRRMYLHCIPNFDELPTLERRYEAEKLRAALRAVRRRERLGTPLH